MKTIAVQEIKRRGVSFLDEDLKEGPVHIIQNNCPQYVILTEDQYQELQAAELEAYTARIKASLQEVKEKKLTHGTAKALIKELGLED